MPAPPAEPFADHFSAVARGYRRYRPGYPGCLFEELAARLRRRALAWDCATGSGQAVAGLLARFDAVVASDASAAQLAGLARVAGVSALVARAERVPLRDGCIDLVTVAQALHWFATAAFYDEVRRVLRPGGLLAAWSYGLLRITPALDRLVEDFCHDGIGPWWPSARRHVEDGYARLEWPFADSGRLRLEMSARWTCDHLLAYLGTWSAVSAYRRERGADPLEPLAPALRAAWGSCAMRTVRWPLAVVLAWPHGRDQRPRRVVVAGRKG